MHKKMKVCAVLSDSHIEQDDVDADRWRQFVQEVRALARRPEYLQLDIDVEADVP